MLCILVICCFFSFTRRNALWGQRFLCVFTSVTPMLRRVPGAQKELNKCLWMTAWMSSPEERRCSLARRLWVVRPSASVLALEEMCSLPWRRGPWWGFRQESAPPPPIPTTYHLLLGKTKAFLLAAPEAPRWWVGLRLAPHCSSCPCSWLGYVSDKEVLRPLRPQLLSWPTKVMTLGKGLKTPGNEERSMNGYSTPAYSPPYPNPGPKACPSLGPKLQDWNNWNSQSRWGLSRDQRSGSHSNLC